MNQQERDKLQTVADRIVKGEPFFQKLQDWARFSSRDGAAAAVLYDKNLPSKVRVSASVGPSTVECVVHLPAHGTLPADQAVADATQRGLDELAHQIFAVGVKALDAVRDL